jgi:hypothetical protein
MEQQARPRPLHEHAPHTRLYANLTNAAAGMLAYAESLEREGNVAMSLLYLEWAAKADEAIRKGDHNNLMYANRILGTRGFISTNVVK